MTGADNLMVMGIYGYLSGTTAPENRTFRFGVFEQFVTFIPTVFLPLVGYLHARIGYESKSALPYMVDYTTPFITFHSFDEQFVDENCIDNPGFLKDEDTQETPNENLLPPDQNDTKKTQLAR